MREAAEKFGLPLLDREMTYNTRLAQELGVWAETKGKGDEFGHAVFRACLVHGLNIGKVPILLEVARSVGLPEGEAKKVLETRAFRGVIDFDWARSRRMGVTEIPTIVIGQHSLMGAQPYDAFEQLMRVCGIEKKGIGEHCRG